MLGIWTEEMDAPAEHITNSLEYAGKSWKVTGARALVHANGAKVLSVYQEDFYAGYPALTENSFGKGRAYFISSQNEQGFIKCLTENLAKEAGTLSSFAGKLPHGVTVKERKPLEQEEGESLFFLQNFNNKREDILIRKPYRDIEKNIRYSEVISMEPYQCQVLCEEKDKWT